MADPLTSVYKGILGFNYWWILWTLIVGLIIVGIVSFIKGKNTYRYPVRIFKVRENGGTKESNCKGGYIGRKNSGSFFRIKTGIFPWQTIDLNTTPDPRYMDQDNRVYYKQIDVGTYIQLKRDFDDENNSVMFSPVEQDVKYGAVLDIQRIKEVLRTESRWVKLAPYFALIIVGLFLTIMFYFVVNAKCPNVAG